MKVRKLDCRGWLLGFVTVLFLCAGLANAQEKPQLTSLERQLNIDSFEYLWKTIHENHFDPTFGGVDWKAMRLEFHPRIEAARDKSDARTVMRQMLSRLKLTHFNIIPSELYEGMNQTGGQSSGGGVTGINVRVVSGHALVISVDSGSSAEQAGVKPSWEIVQIGKEEIPGRLAAIAKEFVLEGNGLTPDVEVKHTREALLQGRDLVLEEAVNWIRKQH